MKKINKKGFTLIELLVVIAIIGLLSTMAVISLNSARQKARDAKRMSDVKQMATLLSLAASELPDAYLMCGAAACADGALTTTVSGAQTAAGTPVNDPDLAAEFKKFEDPTTPGTACTIGGNSPCGYTIEVDSAQNDLQTVRIHFLTEGTTGTLSANTVHAITSEGVLIDAATSQ